MTTDIHQQLSQAEATRREILSRREAEAERIRRENQTLAETEATIQQLTRERQAVELQTAVERLQTRELAANTQAAAALYAALNKAAQTGVIDLPQLDPIIKQLEASHRLANEERQHIFDTRQGLNRAAYLASLPEAERRQMMDGNALNLLELKTREWAAANHTADVGDIPEPTGVRQAIGQWITDQATLRSRKVGAMVAWFYTGVMITPAPDAPRVYE